eukprot:SAG31_NODE_10394_length_1143_cov_3.360153_2_plen_78_part_00
MHAPKIHCALVLVCSDGAGLRHGEQRQHYVRTDVRENRRNTPKTRSVRRPAALLTGPESQAVFKVGEKPADGAVQAE